MGGALRGGAIRMSGVHMTGDIVIDTGEKHVEFHNGVRLTNISHVFLVVLTAATAATIISVLPVVMMVRFERYWLGRMLALAVGLIAGGVIANSQQAFEGDTVLATEGVAFGAVITGLVLYLTTRRSNKSDEDEIDFWKGSDLLDPDQKRKGGHRVTVLISVFAISEIVEGLAIGISFGAGEALGDTLSIAMLLESLPKGMLLGLILVQRIGKLKTALFCAAAHAAQPFAAAGAFYFETAFKAYMPFCLGSAAGLMGVFLTVEVIPSAARASASYLQVLAIAIVSGGLLLGYIHAIQSQDIVVQ
jgi:zinc transporter ZupT